MKLYNDQRYSIGDKISGNILHLDFTSRGLLLTLELPFNVACYTSRPGRFNFSYLIPPSVAWELGARLLCWFRKDSDDEDG